MRTLPIDLSASRADLELIEIQFGQWLEAVEHGFLCHWLQQMVAAQAAMEGGDSSGEIEAPDHFSQLLERVEGPQAIAIRDCLPHEQAPVAAEQDPFLPLGGLSQLLILNIIAVETVESQHPQISAQPPEMIIEHKARLHGTSIWDGMDVDLVTILGDRIQRSFLTIDLYRSDLRVRHPQRLSQMLHGLSLAKLHLDRLAPLIARQKIVQSTEELEKGRAHREIIFPVPIALPAELRNLQVISTCQYLCYK